MTIKQLASKIAKREGKRSQARIGDIREIEKKCEHEPLRPNSVLLREGKDPLEYLLPECAKCGVRLKAKWEAE